MANSRRLPLAVLASLLLSACAPKTVGVSMVAPPAAPPAGKIERLLVWFAVNNMVDAAAVGQGLKAKLLERGIAVEFGASQPLELDRAEAQRPLISRFKPTYRLEIDVASSQRSSNGSFVIVRASLYRGNGASPVRIISFTSGGRASANLTEAIVDKLQGDGLI